MSLLKFCPVAVSSTSSLALSQASILGTQSSLSSAIDRVPECPNLISTVLRSQSVGPTDGECADVVTQVLVDVDG